MTKKIHTPRILFLLIIVSVTMIGVPTPAVIRDLKSRYDSCIAKDPEYEMKAILAFLGNDSFMQKCLPADAPVHKPIRFWFEIKPDGRVANFIFQPESSLAACILEATRSRTLPAPPTVDCVMLIDLKFTR